MVLSTGASDVLSTRGRGITSVRGGAQIARHPGCPAKSANSIVRKSSIIDSYYVFEQGGSFLAFFNVYTPPAPLGPLIIMGYEGSGTGLGAAEMHLHATSCLRSM